MAHRRLTPESKAPTAGKRGRGRAAVGESFSAPVFSGRKVLGSSTPQGYYFKWKEIKNFSDKQKLKGYCNTNPLIKEILKGRL